MDWIVYMIHCSDDSLYTGVTKDVDRRFAEHAGNIKGARYFNGRDPIAIVFTEDGHDRSSALIREAAIKRLSREAKLRLISDQD